MVAEAEAGEVVAEVEAGAEAREVEAEVEAGVVPEVERATGPKPRNQTKARLQTACPRARYWHRSRLTIFIFLIVPPQFDVRAVVGYRWHNDHTEGLILWDGSYDDVDAVWQAGAELDAQDIVGEIIVFDDARRFRVLDCVDNHGELGICFPVSHGHDRLTLLPAAAANTYTLKQDGSRQLTQVVDLSLIEHGHEWWMIADRPDLPAAAP